MRRSRALLGALALSAMAVGAPAVAVPIQASVIPAGTPSTAASSPVERAPRPGPSILYAPPARAPQFENTGVWRAEPTRVCMTSAYRAGEFLYQGCLWDDHGGGPAYNWFHYTFMRDYTYPTNPAYRNNAANIVEVRLKPLAGATAVRITYNTMTDPNLVAATIALGDSAAPVDAPHGANTKLPASVFVTAHGTTGDIVDAATGTTRPERPAVTTDLERRQVEVRVPYSAFDPRGSHTVRVAAASGLWDRAGDRYLVPRDKATETEPGGAPANTAHPSAFFNVAFRYAEPFSAWRDHLQLAAVAAGDISPFHATVDFTKLAAGANDDMAGQATGVPRSGYMNILFASQFESRQGRRLPDDPNGPPFGANTQQNGFSTGSPGASSKPSGSFGWPCRDGCVPDLPSRLQRALIYVPQAAPPAQGYASMLWLPGYAESANDQVQGEGDLFHSVGDRAGTPTIVIDVDGRGNDQWYYGQSGASVFETLADVGRRFRLDPDRTALGGFSSGGYGANKLALTFPDLFGRAFICDGLNLAPSFPGINGVADTAPADTVTTHEAGSRISDLLPSRRNQPVMEWAGLPDDFIPYNITRKRADDYAAGDYDYEFISWVGLPSEHLLMCNQGTWSVLTKWMGDMRRVVDPARVTYVRNPLMDDPASGLVGDHAYWLSAIETRAQQLGTIDVTSSGFGAGPRPSGPPARTADTAPSKGFIAGSAMTGANVPVEAPANPYLREYRHPGAGPAETPADTLTITATNIRHVTIDPSRAHVSCGATLNVTTDGPLSVHLLGCGDRVFGATSASVGAGGIGGTGLFVPATVTGALRRSL